MKSLLKLKLKGPTLYFNLVFKLINYIINWVHLNRLMERVGHRTMNTIYLPNFPVGPTFISSMRHDTFLN